ncbi:hypothetical protein P875_00010687 [Aspergillus parasiticus SU-1]|uniref:JmjC domain-containing protein n=1 Tax=Aspergillus parasiticus (strain ATCC 56775 / NRRL 5862 / SRRC 143 / SU-1) TaxID=1403190 RepID=A0A0F0ID67_ASPPU|nr:hypothetical protein P875_00010687 [Aspergillus parasiticus SU-1]
MEFSQSNIPSAQDLLRSGELFVPFSEFPVQTIYETPGWFEKKLQEGKPFVIRGLNQIDCWDASTLNNGCLVTSSSSGAIPVRNCQTGRDVRMRLRDLIPTDHSRAGHVRESLYAKDLQCPAEWIRALKAVLPSYLIQLGSFDLFRVLPKEITPEVLMAYVGTKLSLSGFHRCFSGTVALNLMIESEGSRYGSLCFGTDQTSQEKYDMFMEGLGKSSHTDWANISIAQMKTANFPIYVTHQEPGDLVIFPSATAHQIWNVSSMVTKVDKPIRARIKPVDPRGRIAGFVDNVFDQKRGKRAVSVTQIASSRSTLEHRGQKRPRLPNNDGHERSLHEAVHSSESVDPSQNRRSDIAADVEVPHSLPMRGSSTGSFNSKGQLRISDLVEDRSSPDKSFHRSPHVQAHISLSSTPDNTTYRYPHEPNNHNENIPNPIDEENIPSLERKLGALRQYADGLLELSLIDSHAKVLDKISSLEAQIERKRRQKAELLFSSLNRDFPDLADIAMEEARRRGI